MMSTDGESKKGSSCPQLVVLNKSFKLAEQWVSNQGNSLDDAKSNEVVLVSRPPRLGIGAAIPRQSENVCSNDPVERKLRAKLYAKRRKILKNTEASAISVKDGRVDEESDDNELESKTKAFAKKRPTICPHLCKATKEEKMIMCASSGS